MKIQAGEAIPTGVEKVLNREQAAAFLAGYDAGHLIALECEKDALALLLPAEAVARLAVFPSIRPEALALFSAKPFDGNLADLVYIRPAVFTTSA
ncbi:hypothetical protein SDC9_177641 [bioreactor metagenome]|uniref:Uncharacterized protein n=1 Tax=bioreactor metagenome TaxID=1076179 RepID=A0A645H2W8_9ZZZZ